MFCKYKNIFGMPNTGLHAIRIFDFAIIDIILSILLYNYLNKYLNKYLNIYIFIFCIILIHRLFCVNTTLNKLIFGEI